MRRRVARDCRSKPSIAAPCQVDGLIARDVRKWLEDLRLGKYVETFVANDIDLDVLHDLDENNLEWLGLSIGHRKKLLRAIVDLETGPRAEPGPPREMGEVGKPPLAIAERRQLTAMFPKKRQSRLRHAPQFPRVGDCAFIESLKLVDA